MDFAFDFFIWKKKLSRALGLFFFVSLVLVRFWDLPIYLAFFSIRIHSVNERDYRKSSEFGQIVYFSSITLAICVLLKLLWLLFVCMCTHRKRCIHFVSPKNSDCILFALFSFHSSSIQSLFLLLAIGSLNLGESLIQILNCFDPI